ncbi:hypothetical protein [Nostoc sp.]|uniref:hypothetical protein n=1 Tax=Nostoc sp. TaxID=1180 RepID=UPI002FF4C603
MHWKFLAIEYLQVGILQKIEQTADERAMPTAIPLGNAPSPNNFDKITMVLVNSA